MARLRAEGSDPIQLTDRVVTIGRDASNTISLAEPGVSKHHALLIREDDTHKLFDLHSANGTWVNGERITTAKLNDGDVVRFGPRELRYETAIATATGPRKLALPSEQPVIAPKKLADEQSSQSPRIRLKRD